MEKYINSSHLFKLCIGVLTLLLMGCQDTEETLEVSRCGSVEYFVEKIKTDPNYRNKHYEIEGLIKEYYNTVAQGAAGLRGGRVVIPIVVHVLHNGEDVGTGTNISDAQIQSQIDVMNRDFRRLNADISTVPSAFSSLVADARIEFQLAKRDPDCNSTTGITRQRAGTTSYTVGGNEAKSSTSGGVDPWDTSKYLNIWIVGSIVGSAIGYSSFPNEAPNLQGFVSESDVFGNVGSVSPTSPFNDGRTAVHEFGHFFDLHHLEGVIELPGGGLAIDNNRDSNCVPSECDGTDYVDDTPNQGTQNFGIPTFPVTDCCTTGGNGLMFMNYMDFVDDSAMVMFSQDQVDRMIATLYTTQASLIGSDGLLPPPDSSTADLYIQDTPEDIGNEPNNESDRFHISEDIWVRNAIGTMNQEHENPTYIPGGGGVYVYVRVRNRGCAPSENANVKLYWAKASTGLSWTAPWDGSLTIGTALMGGEIDTKLTGVVQGGDFTILEYQWTNVPNPADYASLGGDESHFCLLARIETSSGMTFPETTNLGGNVKNNNNIAWKNISIARETMPGGRQTAVFVGNYEEDREYEMILSFENANDIEASVFDYGDVFLRLAPELIQKWEQNGSQGEGVAKIDDDLIEIKTPGARLSGMLLDPKEIYACTLIFNETQKTLGPNVYFMDMLQYSGSATPDNLIGGQRFLLKSWNQ